METLKKRTYMRAGHKATAEENLEFTKFLFNEVGKNGEKIRKKIERARRNKAREDLASFAVFGTTMLTLLSQMAMPYVREPPIHNTRDFIELGGIGALVLAGTIYGLYKTGQHLYYALRERFGLIGAESDMKRFLAREYPNVNFLINNRYDRF